MSQFKKLPLTERGVRVTLSLVCHALIFTFVLMGPGSRAAQHQKHAQEAGAKGDSSAAMVRARRDFETRCSSCHGLDGRGGEHAPNISTDPAILSLPDGEIYKIVHDGIPSKGMPAFDQLGKIQIQSMVNYLRAMGRHSGWEWVSGDPLQGETLFFGKAACAGCHMMRGRGGFLGSDLTDYSATHGPGEAREATLNPRSLNVPHPEMVTMVTPKGERYFGVVRNEDNFSIQVMRTDGTFHNFIKSEVGHLERSKSPVMPGDYGERLTPGELDDLMSFLAPVRQHSQGEFGKGIPGRSVKHAPNRIPK